MKQHWTNLQSQWRRLPGRTRMGLAICLVALTGLLWQHSTTSRSSDNPTPAPAATQPDHQHPGSEDEATGEYQPDPADLPTRMNFTPEAAHAVAERFATNFANPAGGHDEWLERLSPDITIDLLEQYRMTDIRNVPETTVDQTVGPLPGDPMSPALRVSYTDGSTIEIRLTMSTDGWQVATVLPVTAAAASPNPDTTAEPTPASSAPVPTPMHLASATSRDRQ